MPQEENSVQKASYNETSSACPKPLVGWFFEKEKAPIDKETKECAEWLPFTAADSIILEQEFTAACKSNYKGNRKVVVGADRLFEVDLRSMKMIPIYWSIAPQTTTNVRRSNWFWKAAAANAEHHHPVETAISCSIEAAYQRNYAFISANLLDVDAVDKLMRNFRSSDKNASSHETCENADDAPKSSDSSPKKVNVKTHSFTLTFPLETPFWVDQQKFVSGVFVCDEADTCWLRTEKSAPIASMCARSSLKKLLSTGKLFRNVYKPPPPLFPSKDDAGGNAKPKEGTVAKAAASASEGEFEQTKVQDLIFIVHGVAQKFIEKSGYPSIIEEADSTREIMKDIVKKRNGQYDFQLIPIRWRHIFNFFGDDSAAAAHFDRLQEKIMLPSLPTVRSLMSEFAIDILLYMTEEHYERILTFMINEMNRVHALFIEKNPNFTGNIHILGHSLGSVLSFNLLSSRYDGQTCSSRLNFKIDKFFAIGSPIGLFILLKKLKLNGTRRGASFSAKSKSKCTPIVDPFLENDCFLDCNEFYNLFHPHDPVAYRIEPLMDVSLADCRPLTVRAALMLGGPYGGDDPMRKSYYFNTAAFGMSKRSKKARKSTDYSSPTSDSENSSEIDSIKSSKTDKISSQATDPIKLISNSFRNLFWGNSATPSDAPRLPQDEETAAAATPEKITLISEGVTAAAAVNVTNTSTTTMQMTATKATTICTQNSNAAERSLSPSAAEEFFDASSNISQCTTAASAPNEMLPASLPSSDAPLNKRMPFVVIEAQSKEFVGDVVQPKKSVHSAKESNHRTCLKPFNEYRRVDFSLSEGILEYSYLSMFSAHTAYWKDRETMKFILNVLKSTKTK